MIVDLNTYATNAQDVRISFNSSADRVTLYICRGSVGMFDPSTLEVEAFYRSGSQTEFHASYDVERDGNSRVQVWLVPGEQVSGGVWTDFDGQNGTVDRRRVVDLGV